MTTPKRPNASIEFWTEFRPEVARLHQARTPLYYQGERSAVPALACLHQYVIKGFADGVRYETRLAWSRGAQRSDILDVLSIAFIHSGHVGMYPATTVAPLLREYTGPAPAGTPFPRNWAFERGAFSSGMDFSRPEATKADLDALEDWYVATIGEVPRHARFLRRNRPDLLKAHRNRYENAISESLPKQMLPYLLLHYDIYRGFADGIRENLLLARAFGLTKRQVLDAISSSVLHAGSAGLNLVDSVAADILATWPSDERGET
jgi:hypothetical protein